MARGVSLEASLDRLAQIRKAAVEEPELSELRSFLASKHSHAVAAAAEIAGEQGLDELRPLLVGAFHRLMENPIKRDPGCRGKAAVAEALHQLDAPEAELYLAGIEHEQMEPVWGGRQDTASELRTACGRGLVRMRHVDALLHLADLLADSELSVRLGAAQSIAYHGTAHGLPILRLKVHSGDPEIEVIAECLLSILRISPESSRDFVAGFLRSADPSLAEAAALALGESRAEGAFDALRDWRCDAAGQGLGEVALMALAMLRSDPAIEYLLSLVASEPGPAAREAIAAFAIHRHDQSMRARVEAAARREDVDLDEALEEAFGD